MVKSKKLVEEKMQDRITTAGKYLRLGMDEAEDPIEVLLKDPEGYGKKLAAGVTESMRRGAYKVGLVKAQKRNAWKNATERAGAHFEERADDIVSHSMESYEGRAECIEKAKAVIKLMPNTTRAQRIARSGEYLKLTGECMDKLFGRKG